MHYARIGQRPCSSESSGASDAEEERPQARIASASKEIDLTALREAWPPFSMRTTAGKPAPPESASVSPAHEARKPEEEPVGHRRQRIPFPGVSIETPHFVRAGQSRRTRKERNAAKFRERQYLHQLQREFVWDWERAEEQRAKQGESVEFSFPPELVENTSRLMDSNKWLSGSTSSEEVPWGVQVCGANNLPCAVACIGQENEAESSHWWNAEVGSAPLHW